MSGTYAENRLKIFQFRDINTQSRTVYSRQKNQKTNYKNALRFAFIKVPEKLLNKLNIHINEKNIRIKKLAFGRIVGDLSTSKNLIKRKNGKYLRE